MIVANKNKIVKLAENLASDEQTLGRSLWADARTRFMRNKAAITSLVILVLIVLFSFVGPYFAVWTYEQIDWNTMGSAATLGMPSIETGHYFGTDDLGRDIYSRVIQGTQISLMVGIVG
ncbi:MAG: peptide ABC transporter permease, partial [Gammaproteobacteria bacterium]